MEKAISSIALNPTFDSAQVLLEAKQAGVDVDALRYNLSLTPEQRLKKFQKALAWHEFAKISKKKDTKKETMCDLKS